MEGTLSDSDMEWDAPLPTRGKGKTRGRGRGRAKTASTNNKGRGRGKATATPPRVGTRKSSRTSKGRSSNLNDDSVIMLDDDSNDSSLIHCVGGSSSKENSNDSFFAANILNTNINSSIITASMSSLLPTPELSEASKPNEAPLTTIQPDIASTIESEAPPDPKPVCAPPKKATKRGLAKKSTVTDVQNVTTSHDVYSRQVNTMKQIYDKTKESAATKDKENDVSTSFEAEKIEIKPVTASKPFISTDALDDRLSDDDEFKSPASQKSSIAEYARAKPATPIAREPTPPPAPNAKLQPGKKKRMNKKLTKAYNDLMASQNRMKQQNLATPVRKHPWQSADVVFIEEESPIRQTEMSVKVRYLSKVHRLDMKMVDPFHVLISRLSKVLNEPEHELSLFLNDKPLALHATLKEVGLTVADIIECYCIKSNSADDSDSINVFIQCNHKRSKEAMKTKRRQPLSHLLQEYAEKMSLDVTKLKFFFEGDEVEETDTTDKLDMEDDDVLDVVIQS